MLLLNGREQWLHFIGVGGMGMSGLASLALDLGLRVSGSDCTYGEHLQPLIDKGLKFFGDHDPKHLQLGMTLVLSTAIPSDNPELARGRELALPIWHRSDLLAFFIHSHPKSMVVAGCHGKTTTTSLLGWILHQAGFTPTIISGGIMRDFHANLVYGPGPWLVAEADESDQSFLKYHPHFAIITNIDNDHMEKYESFGAIQEAFLVFMNQTRGHLFLNHEDPTIRALLPRVRTPYTLFGLDTTLSIHADSRHPHPTGQSFRLTAGSDGDTINTRLGGVFNVLNILGAVAVARHAGAKRDIIKSAVESFHGVEKRFDTLGEREGIPIFADYGHHPREIRSTLEMTRERYPGHYRVVIIEPHRYSRVHLLGREFLALFREWSTDSEFLFLPIYGASETQRFGLEPDTLFSQATAVHPRCHFVADPKKMAQFLEKRVAESAKTGRPTLFLFLGAGNVHTWAKRWIATPPAEISDLTTLA